MAGDASSSGKDSKPHLHPAYSVTNIQSKIRTLDGKTTNYSSWVKLFKLHLKAYKVLSHIDGTPPPPETDPTYVEWSELDALILQWIYSTINDDTLDRVMENDISAHDAWLKIQDVFLSNKKARAAALLHEFTHTTLKDCASMDAYCQKLKDLSRQLADVDKPVDDSSLIIQLVNGLPKELDTIGTIINNGTPSWNEARTMIDLEMRRLSARTSASEGTNNESLLYTSRSQNKAEYNNTNPRTGQIYPGSNYRGNNYDPTFNLRMGRGGRSNRGRGGRNQNSNTRPTGHTASYQIQQPNNQHNHTQASYPKYPHSNTTVPQYYYPFQQPNLQTPPPSPYPSAPPAPYPPPSTQPHPNTQPVQFGPLAPVLLSQPSMLLARATSVRLSITCNSTIGIHIGTWTLVHRLISHQTRVKFHLPCLFPQILFLLVMVNVY